MALIKCPSCDKDISPSAAACPQCGHPMAPPHDELKPERRKASGRGGILLLVAALAGGAFTWFCSTQLRSTGTHASDLNVRPKEVAAKSTPSVRTVDETPPKTEIDRAINLVLAKRIDWEVTTKNLFVDYKITNEYQETARGYLFFTYEFTADCEVASDAATISVDGSGREFRKYVQVEAARLLAARNPSAKNQRIETKRVPLSGSVSLVKKGIKWYVE